MVFYLPFVPWVPICKYKWPDVFVLLMLKENEGCKEENLETKRCQDCHCSAFSVLASWALLCSLSAQESCARRAGRLARSSAWDTACTATCIGAELSPCSAAHPETATTSRHFWYPWNPHSPSGRFLGAKQCPGQLPAAHEMRKGPHTLNGLLEKQECQASVLREGTSSRQWYKAAIRVFWLPAHGCLALSPSEIPSLGRIHGPAVSWGSALPELLHSPLSFRAATTLIQAIQRLLLQGKIRKIQVPSFSCVGTIPDPSYIPLCPDAGQTKLYSPSLARRCSLWLVFHTHHPASPSRNWAVLLSLWFPVSDGLILIGLYFQLFFSSSGRMK